MNTTLWVLQAVLAAAFFAAGLLKLTQPKDKLAPKLPWVDAFSVGTVRLIGLAELLGAIGLILPAVTGIAPILTPIAAAALALVMILAAVVHVRRREPSGVAFNAALFLIAAVIAWGRFGAYAL